VIDVGVVAESALDRIWSRVVDELVVHQDAASGGKRGQVLNPISGMPYSRDTAFAAQVFATEYGRTGETRWRSRATDALECLHETNVYGGLDEPIWDRYGWHFRRGSLATTGMLLDAVWQAENLLHLDHAGSWRSLLDYLETCSVGPGLYAHDSVEQGIRPRPVQNTTAMALYLLEYAALNSEEAREATAGQRSLLRHALRRGQRADGFWPYVYPGRGQQLYFRFGLMRPLLARLPVLRRYVLRGGDSSVFFGDAVHHCLVLHYLARSLWIRGEEGGNTGPVKTGWDWARSHLVTDSSGAVSFDFSWEPKPLVPRYCNFGETTTYFLILATLPYLVRAGVGEGPFGDLAARLLDHIATHLLEPEGSFPSVRAYEGPVEVLRNILPRVGESAAWKGACLARFVTEGLPQPAGSAGSPIARASGDPEERVDAV
jgi:hypothetical protein